MFSLRDYPLWFYKIFTLKDLYTIYPSNSYNLFREVAFSIRAGCFLFSSRLYSLSNIPNPSRKDSRTSKVHNLSTSKSPQPSTKQSPQPFYKQAHNLPTSKAHNLPTSKVHSHSTSKSPQPHHIPIAQKNTQKTSKSSKISPIFYPLTYF